MEIWPWTHVVFALMKNSALPYLVVCILVFLHKSMHMKLYASFNYSQNIHA